MLLSILVPVYNVEAFLSRCMESLIELSLPDYEIILVDDGSTDTSGKICDEWGKKYDYVKVVHQSNMGLVAARNTALVIAKGKYVTFVDSDDWVDRGLLPCLVTDLETYCEVDIAVGSMVRNSEINIDLPHLSRGTGKLTKAQAVEAMVKKEGMHWYLCGKVFRSRLFLEQKVDTQVTIFEDLDRIWPVIMRTRNFFFDNKYAYHYFVNVKSLTKRRCDLNLASWRVFKRVLFSGYTGSVKQEIANFYVQVFLRHTLEMYFVNRDEFRSEIESYIYELKETLHISGAVQNVLSDRDYKAVSSNYASCIRYYDHIFDNLRLLLKKVRKDYHYLYIYGIGVVAQYVAAIMNEIDISPDAYVVSDGEPKSDSFMGTRVYYLSEVRYGSDIAFVLALTGNAEKAVTNILYKKNERLSEGNLGIFSVGFPPMIF